MHKVKWHVFSTAILASAWIACNKMKKVWTSKLLRATTIRLFRATVKSVLHYGSDDVDRDEEAGEKCQWMLHQNAANGPACALLTTAYEQSGAIREPSKS